MVDNIIRIILGYVKTQIIKIAQRASNKILRKLQYGLMAESNGQTMVHGGF